MLTPPEKRDPPQSRRTEREWAQENAKRKNATVIQHWVTNEDFLYCHWLAKSEQDVYRTLEEMGMEGRLINSMAHEAHWYETAFRNSDKITPNLPENGYSW